MLRADELSLVDFAGLLPRLDGVEPDGGFFAVVRGRLGDGSPTVDFFAAGRGLLDGAFLAAGDLGFASAAPLPDETCDGAGSEA